MKTTISEADPLAVYRVFYTLCGGLIGQPAILPDERLVLVINGSRIAEAHNAIAKFQQSRTSDWNFDRYHAMPSLAYLYLLEMGIPHKFVDNCGTQMIPHEYRAEAKQSLENLKAALPDVVILEALVDKEFVSYGSSASAYLGASGG